ncbi:hypothetical protein UZ36_07515 [Candidatus Nitromaritima sp. SCGC AAA799-C22]|nr:hypothetical protein UZ36_07515 [Candidatus Nitromaritima sp. SCGC AAA799-C22]
MTLTQLSYILAVSKTRNFSRAAQSCHVTQPTLSMQIQKLEEALGIVLFDRSKKPVEPTLVGRKVIKQAQTVIQNVFKIEELIKIERGEIKGEFKLGIIPTLAPYLLPLFIESFIKKYPQVNLIIEELQTGQILNKLKEDSLDAGILVTPLNRRGIVERPLFHEPFVVYLNPNHPLHSLKKVSEKDLSLNDIWLLKEGHCFRNQAFELCKKIRGNGTNQKNPVFESGNLETLKRLVDKNFGYTLLPYLAAKDVPEKDKVKKLRYFKTPVPIREVSMAYSRAYLKQSTVEALFKMIVSSLPNDLKKSDLKSRVVDVYTMA